MNGNARTTRKSRLTASQAADVNINHEIFHLRNANMHIDQANQNLIAENNDLIDENDILINTNDTLVDEIDVLRAVNHALKNENRSLVRNGRRVWTAVAAAFAILLFVCIFDPYNFAKVYDSFVITTVLLVRSIVLLVFRHAEIFLATAMFIWAKLFWLE